MRIPGTMTFNERLDSLLDQRGITNYRLAKDTGISDGAIRSWRKGRVKSPNGAMLHKIADYLHVNPQWLLEGKVDAAPSYRDRVKRMSEKLERFAANHSEKDLDKIERYFDIMTGDEGNESNTFQKKAGKRRKQRTA